MIRRLFSGCFTLPSVSVLEGFFMRLLFAMALLYTMRMPVSFQTEPHPVGLLRILHSIDDHRTWLTWLNQPQVWEISHWTFIVLMMLYVAGMVLPMVLPAAAILQILPYTLLNSQGANSHGWAMISMVLVIQACTVLYHAAATRFSAATLLPPDARLRSWLLVQSMVIVTGAYFISMITKMQNSHGMWFYNADHIALDMVKAQRQSYYNQLNPAYAGIPKEALWMLQHVSFARVFFSSGVLLEAVAIFAIGNRLLALLIGASLIAMHRSIDWLMGGVAFPLDELCDFIFLIGLPFGMAWSLERIKNIWVRHGILIGVGVGIVASWEVHRHLGRVPTPLAEYLLALVYKTCGVWSSQEWIEYFQFVAPAMSVGAVGGLTGAFVGWLAGLRGGAKPTLMSG